MLYCSHTEDNSGWRRQNNQNYYDRVQRSCDIFAGSKTGTGSVRAQVSNSEFCVTDSLIRLSSINSNYPTFTMATGKKKLAGPPF